MAITSLSRTHELFPLTISLFLLILICVFIMRAIIMNFLEDRDVGILYLSTKFELDQSINNKQESLETQTDTQIESDTLPI